VKYLTLSAGRKGSAPYRGATTAGCLLFLIIAGVAGYVGLKFGEAYWNYFEMRHKTREVLNWAAAHPPKTDKEIAQRLMAKAAEAEVELSSENIQILQRPDNLTITVSWGREVEFPYYTFLLNFKTTQTEEKRWYKRGVLIK